ncbi:plasma-membrane choline transporter (macronuclear) [Tetrahymena thermophila SB210]|uniref:Choline transporter-like protein n=1 Tax=Tetrahymena thermophila (strain SB210) TaxID=312017 RepID=I7MDW7_TETTS|nr:plasma-membrane choline transporter [Tetrahymena thermophila SB210]EAR92862.2 plasma-membrane choline transporter [Tetrahymena thermophila SB210]|eukprot:XP_001013107.2 plasma-membrane choline transporter [Tetrahymena thermophila SB210]
MSKGKEQVRYQQINMSKLPDLEKIEKKESSEEIMTESIKVTYKYKENDPNYMGDKIGTDRNLIHGPIKNRGITDCICSLLFIGFLVGLFFSSIYSFSEGSTTSYALPYDTDGNVCGKSSGFQNYKYIFLLDPQSGDYSKSVCVSSCPTKTQEQDIVEFKCKQNSQIQIDSNNGLCKLSSAKFFNTTKYVTACIPDDEALKAKTQSYLQPSQTFQQHMADLQASWPVMLGSIFISLAIGYIYLFMMKKFSGCLTWFCIITVISSFFVVGGLMVSNDTIGIISSGTVDSNQKEGIKVLGSFCIIFGIVSLLYVLCKCKQIRMGIALVDVSSDYTTDVCTSQLIPFVMWFIYVLCLVFLLLAGVYAYGIGEESDQPQNPFNKYIYNSNRYLILFYIFGLIWISEFLSIYAYFLVSSSAQQWYFKRSYQSLLKSPVKQAVKLGFYHLGTLAYASLVLPLYTIANFIFEIFYGCGKGIQSKETERKRAQSQYDAEWENNSKDQIDKVSNCCVSCSNLYEGRFRFVKKEGIIQTALTGRDFKKACHESFYLMKRNEKYFKSLQGLGSLMLLLGKCFICCSSTFLCYLILSDSETYKKELYSPVLPTVLITYITFTIGNIFVTVYSSSSDSILQSFCVDEELHNEMKESTGNTPQKLLQFLDKYTDIIKDQKSEKI